MFILGFRPFFLYHWTGDPCVWWYVIRSNEFLYISSGQVRVSFETHSENSECVSNKVKAWPEFFFVQFLDFLNSMVLKKHLIFDVVYLQQWKFRTKYSLFKMK